MKESLYKLYTRRIADRFLKLEKEFPGLISLAIIIKRIPSNFTENERKPHSSLQFLLMVELREVTNKYEKKLIGANTLSDFISRGTERAKKAIGDVDDREKIAHMVRISTSVRPKNKAAIIQLLRA
jgi:hypothetical protein